MLRPPRARLAQLGISSAEIHARSPDRTWYNRPAGSRWAISIFESSRPANLRQLLTSETCSSSKTARRRPSCISKMLRRSHEGMSNRPPTSCTTTADPRLGWESQPFSEGTSLRWASLSPDGLRELQAEMPIGMEIESSPTKADSVNTAVNGFIISLAEALAIVIGVLMLTMGLRSGVLIGGILLLTDLATFIVYADAGDHPRANKPGSLDYRARDAGRQRYRGG